MATTIFSYVVIYVYEYFEYNDIFVGDGNIYLPMFMAGNSSVQFFIKNTNSNTDLPRSDQWMMGFSPAELTDGEKMQQHIDCENDGEIN